MLTEPDDEDEGRLRLKFSLVENANGNKPSNDDSIQDVFNRVKIHKMTIKDFEEEKKRLDDLDETDIRLKSYNNKMMNNDSFDSRNNSLLKSKVRNTFKSGSVLRINERDKNSPYRLRDMSISDDYNKINQEAEKYNHKSKKSNIKENKKY